MNTFTGTYSYTGTTGPTGSSGVGSIYTGTTGPTGYSSIGYTGETGPTGLSELMTGPTGPQPYVFSNQGLSFITSKTFTGDSSNITINNVFSSSYDNYRVVCKGIYCPGLEGLGIRFSKDGTPDASTYYNCNIFVQTASTGEVFIDFLRNNDCFLPQALWTSDPTYQGGFVIEIQNPYKSLHTSLQARCTWEQVNVFYIERGGWCIVESDVNYDGFNLFGVSLYGTIYFYGYNK